VFCIPGIVDLTGENQQSAGVIELAKSPDELFEPFVGANLPDEKVDESLWRNAKPVTRLLPTHVVGVDADVIAMRDHEEGLPPVVGSGHGLGAGLIVHMDGVGVGE
jgi:hypothetical protein